MPKHTSKKTHAPSQRPEKSKQKPAPLQDSSPELLNQALIHPSPTLVLHLQRTIGNHSTLSLIKGRKPPSLLASTLVSNSAPRIQRLMANVWWDRTPPPAGPLVKDAATERGSGTSGGAHSSAHALFEWAAVNAVHHKNFVQAVGALLALVEAAKDLPGYKNTSDTSAIVLR